MRGQQMIRRAIRSGVTALAVALFAVPQISLAQSTGDQAQVDPMMQKAARIQAMNSQMRVTQAQRVEAAKENKANVERVKAAKAAARAKGIEVPDIGIRGVRATKANNMKGSQATHARGAERSTSATGLPPQELNGLPLGPLDVPDYFTTANWAFGPCCASSWTRCPVSASARRTTSDNYLPVAHPDTLTYPGSDYYEISVRLYEHQFHSDLPPTNVRGYVQTNLGTNLGGTANDVQPDPINWLGPVIIATKDRPIRIKFKNEKPGVGDLKPDGSEYPGGAGGNLLLPVDESIQGSGKGALFPDGSVCDPSPPGVNLHGEDCALYPQTRSAIHLHGGRTPWISDGTPFQWILPASDFEDTANPYKKGVSLYNVPDMPVPGDDETTYYWTNQQSARLMFYHDHAWGITRLNVLAGEAAGILLTDETEAELIADHTLPGYGIPLVIQDRTFVNAAVNPLTGQTFVRDADPTWNAGSGIPDPITGIRAPVTGDFWLPHVYVPAQNPYSTGGVNAFGRWVYGPWFFPPTANLIFPPVPNPYHDANCSDPDPAVLAFCTTPNQPPVIPGTPTPSVGAETFFDTQMVNGQVFPVLDVYEQQYRFRLLNASNDRFVNLNIYQADTTQIAQTWTGGPTPATATEVEMCAVPGLDPLDPLGRICWDQANPRFANWPNDGRVEGVPNPNKLGPDIIYLGTEGGFLPKPVLLTGQPITFVTDPTAFNVGNVADFNLFMGPAERADILIDFTGMASVGNGEFIFYNDAPAAVPAFDPRFDYITGAPDLSANGGYGRVPPWNEAVPGAQLEGPQVGYGPNTRTVMKFRVHAGQDPLAPFTSKTFADIQARWAPVVSTDPLVARQGVFEQSQDPIIVGQADYDGVYTSNPTFPSVWPAWGLSRIEDNTLMFETPTGTFVTFPMEPKAMHDEMGASFDREYARMSTNLGTQLPIPKTNNANMTPFMYTDPTTEWMNAVAEPVSAVLGDGTQIWKISHNGVDMHPIHFHIFDVQVINRVGWDGQIRLPAPQELGWKDTVRIAPLEDTIVAMRPWAPPLPFSVPFSLRALNPAIPIGSGFGFTNIDPITQQPLVPPTVNAIVSFAWEYVWHCHILSHEENDMMRPIVLNVNSTIPPAITTPAAAWVTTPATGNRITWIDPTPVTYDPPSGYPNPAAEIGFRIERATSISGAYSVVGTARANGDAHVRADRNTIEFVDTSATSATTYYRYRVVAFNEAGSSTSPFVATGTAPTAVRLNSVSLAVSNTSSPSGIASATWTKRLTSTTSPIFRALGSGGTPATYEYQFSLTPSGGTAEIVQTWSATNTWVMPLNQAPGVYSVGVAARNGPLVSPRTRSITYTVIVPARATALTLTPTVASPALVGTGVGFTAVATGGGTKQYQFSLDTGAGYVIQSVWGSATTWTLPAVTPVGTYNIKAEVRTSTGDVDQTAIVSGYEIINPAATGVTIVADVASPAGTPVSFLATGAGPAPLSSATGGGYYFQFSTSTDGGATWAIVQPYSTSRVYTMAAGTPPATYLVKVDTRTNTFSAPQATASMTFVLTNTATVSFTSISPVSPGTYGTAVTFTAAGASGTPPYSYRFSLNGTVDRDWATSGVYILPGTTAAGSYTVLVEVSTSAGAPYTVTNSASTTYQINYPAATAVSLAANPAGSATYGASVTFTASGVLPAGLPAGAVYYRFMNGAAVLQDWSTTATFTSSALAAGSYSVTVEVSTATSGWTAQATSTAVPYSSQLPRGDGGDPCCQPC